MDFLLGYDKITPKGNNSGNSRYGAFPKTIQTEQGLLSLFLPKEYAFPI